MKMENKKNNEDITPIIEPLEISYNKKGCVGNRNERYVYMIIVDYGSPFFYSHRYEGFYSNKKAALKVYKKRVKKMFEEKPDMIIPYEFFLKYHVDFDFRNEYIYLILDEEEQYGPQVYDYIWKDYMGYSAEEWEKARKEYLMWEHLTRTRKITLKKDVIITGKNRTTDPEYICSEYVIFN